MTKAEKTEIINLAVATVDHRVAAFEEGLKQLERQVADIRRRIEPPAEPERFVPLRSAISGD